MKLNPDARLYGILDFGYVTALDGVLMANRMLEGGVEILQIRGKKLSDSEIVQIARKVLPLADAANVPLILNDYPHLVDETGADGVHVGQDDMSVAEARAASARDIIVGKSTHSLAQAAGATAERPDYIGFGPLFATPTKPDYAAIGLDDIREAHRLVPVPIFCVGGVKLENLRRVLGAGARRVVIVSGILNADDVVSYCRAARELLCAAP